MRILTIPALLSLSLLAFGCASRGEIETMKRQLDYLERSSMQMQDRIGDMDSLYRETIEKNVAYQVDLKTQLANLLDKMDIIDSRLNDMDNRLNQIVSRQGGRQSLTPAVPDRPDTSGTANSGSGQVQIDPTKIFDNAIKDMKKGDFDLAILQLDELLKQFPDHPLNDDAQYWLAECHYGKRDYARAIPEFEKVEKKYPQSDLVTRALFKLARSYEETGNVARAKPIFERIVKDYPDSFEARQATDKLKELR
jgi:tol-pal system protein YbgF